MPVYVLRVPVALIFYVLEKAYSKLMKGIQNRVIVVGAVLIDKQSARFQRLPNAIDIGFGGGANECHQNQVPLLGSEIELIVSSDDRVQVDTQLRGVFPSDPNRFFRRIEAGDIPSLS